MISRRRLCDRGKIDSKGLVGLVSHVNQGDHWSHVNHVSHMSWGVTWISCRVGQAGHAVMQVMQVMRVILVTDNLAQSLWLWVPESWVSGVSESWILLILVSMSFGFSYSWCGWVFESWIYYSLCLWVSEFLTLCVSSHWVAQTKMQLFNRPGVAGAVLQTPSSLIN